MLLRQDGRKIAFKRDSIPACQVSSRFIGRLQKVEQSCLGVCGCPNGFIGQDELAQGLGKKGLLRTCRSVAKSGRLRIGTGGKNTNSS